MRLLLLVALCGSLSSPAFSQQPPATSAPETPPAISTANDSQTPSTLTVPDGTKVILSLTSPIWTKTAADGDAIYAVSVFPVAVGNKMAIPPGTYFQGTIDVLTKATRKSNQAEFLAHFTRAIFANGYTVNLNADKPIATATVYVQVSYQSDILLDTGSQIEMTLKAPLNLDGNNAAVAARRSKAPPIGPYQSSTKCRPTPGSPGTSDTVIPGTPGTPGTPPTVVPGGPGMPDIVIPGSPGTPGTPATVIPGSPSTPGFACPPPPIVMSGPANGKDEHTFYANLDTSVDLAGKTLAPGQYQLVWTGLGPNVTVKVNRKGKLVVNAPAKVVVSQQKAPQDSVGTRNNPDGTSTLRFVEFQGQAFQLYFD